MLSKQRDAAVTKGNETQEAEGDVVDDLGEVARLLKAASSNG
jgi:hypothetical protein